MSQLTEELPRKVVIAWRAFMATAEGQQGIDYLRHNNAPKCDGANEAELLKSALGWSAYQKALTDIEDTLTFIPKPEKSAEEEPLGR